jgi:hypothetical protein
MSDANDGAISWNPRYAAYAKAHGKTPDAMMEHDRDAWPGGCIKKGAKAPFSKRSIYIRNVF